DVVTAEDDGAHHLPDNQLLERSTALGRILFTHDIRFKAFAEDCQRLGKPFAGLAWGHPMRLTIGRMVIDLELIAKASDPADWQAKLLEHALESLEGSDRHANQQRKSREHRQRGGNAEAHADEIEIHGTKRWLLEQPTEQQCEDRKSTRLNSSHRTIS